MRNTYVPWHGRAIKQIDESWLIHMLLKNTASATLSFTSSLPTGYYVRIELLPRSTRGKVLPAITQAVNCSRKLLHLIEWVNGFASHTKGLTSAVGHLLYRNNQEEHRSIETMCDAIINLIAFIREVIQWLVLSKQWKLWMHSSDECDRAEGNSWMCWWLNEHTK